MALGTLQACLQRADISTRTYYGNLGFADFADAIGLQGYESINESSITDRIGEWTFATAAFPDQDLERLSASLGEPPGLVEQLLRVREAAAVFVDRAEHHRMQFNALTAVRVAGAAAPHPRCSIRRLLRYLAAATDRFTAPGDQPLSTVTQFVSSDLRRIAR